MNKRILRKSAVISICMLLIATVLPVSGNVDVESTSMLISFLKKGILLYICYPGSCISAPSSSIFGYRFNFPKPIIEIINVHLPLGPHQRNFSKSSLSCKYLVSPFKFHTCIFFLHSLVGNLYFNNSTATESTSGRNQANNELFIWITFWPLTIMVPLFPPIFIFPKKSSLVNLKTSVPSVVETNISFDVLIQIASVHSGKWNP